jgi:hypothetical protein
MMQAPKLYPDDLDTSDLSQMGELISAAAGGVPVTLDQDTVATLLDILMPRGTTEPTFTRETLRRLIMALWPDGGGDSVPIDPVELAGTVKSTLDDWHLLH